MCIEILVYYIKEPVSVCVCVCPSVINLDKLSHFQLHNNIIDGALNMVEMWCEPYSGWLWVLSNISKLFIIEAVLRV